MTACRSPRRTLALLLGAALAAPAAAAQPIRVTAQADRRDAPVGMPVTVTVRVRNVEDGATPEVKPPVVDGAKIEQVGQPTAVPTLTALLENNGFHAGGGQRVANLLNGIGQLQQSVNDITRRIGSDPNLPRMPPGIQGAGLPNTNDYTFTYQVTPERTGLLVVPAFTASANGQTKATDPIGLNVTEAKPQSWVRMALSLSNPSPAVGEEVSLNVDLLIQRGQVAYAGKTYPYYPVSKVTLSLPPLDGTKQFEPVRPLEQFAAENAVEPGKRGFRLNGLPTEVKMSHDVADAAAAADPQRYRRRLSVPLRVNEGGRVTLAAAHASGEVFVPAGAGKGHWEPFVVASEPLTFSALDLRQRADRPADFAGIIGPVRVTAQASETKMPAGTPFTLTVRLDGNGVASAAAPVLVARPEFAKSFKVRHEESRTLAGGVREFTYTLRPLSEAATEVPPVEVSYFEPKTNEFGKSASEAIPLQVSAAPNATPDAAPAAATEAPAPADEPEGRTGLDALLPWAEGALALACVACAAAWGVRRWRARRAGVAARRPSPRPAAAKARRPPAAPVAAVAPDVADVRRALQDFLRRHFHLPPGEVTPHDAAECLRRAGVPEGLTRSFAALLDTCEAAEYAPGVVTTSPAELADYAQQLLRQITAAIPEAVAR